MKPKTSVIDKWSYSAMTTLLRNPLAFKKKYILQIYDDTTSPSAVVGIAAHRALEAYFNGKDELGAIDEGFTYINSLSDMSIDYGKTGSRQGILDDYGKAIRSYFEELPAYHKILAVEESIVAQVSTIDGKELPLPLKFISDLIVENAEGEIEVIDHKFVRSYTDGTVDNPNHLIQSMFAYHAVKAKYGKPPARMVFNECKISTNRDGSPQLQPYTVEFEDNYADFAMFYELYAQCTKFVNQDDPIFLPNPNDIFDGQNSFDVFRAGLVGVERPTEVNHKTEQVQFVEKKYIASAHDKVENQAFTPEEKIRLKLQEFNIPVEMAETHHGASVTLYTLRPSRSVPMSRIAKLQNDLALALEAEHIRIEAPIRGTALVGIEVPSTKRTVVPLTKKHFRKGTTELPIGVDVYGKVHYKDLAEMPHLLIAGATGTGKSVMLNVILTCLTNQMSPKDLELILVDPKMVELIGFSTSKHVVKPVVHDAHQAKQILAELAKEMDERYAKLAKAGARSIAEYPMQRKVVVIDEFGDLMLTGGNKKGDLDEGDNCEKLLIRLAQKARAVGIHLILATQRPSVEVVTGLLKANIPTKIAFMTSNSVNSKIILDETGAEELTGKGDMLFDDTSAGGPKRLQGLYI